MKRRLTLLAVLSVLVASAAYAGSIWQVPNPNDRTLHKSLLTTDAGAATVPSAATDGISLVNLKTYNVTAVVDVQVNTAGDIGYWWQTAQDAGGQAANTISNGCKLLAYLYDPVAQVWTTYPTGDLAIATAAAGLTKYTFPAITPINNFGRIAYVPNSSCAAPFKVYITSNL